MLPRFLKEVLLLAKHHFTFSPFQHFIFYLFSLSSFLDKASNSIVECRESSLCALAHSDNNLLVRHVGAVASSVNAWYTGATSGVNFYLASFVQWQRVAEMLGVGR